MHTPGYKPGLADPNLWRMDDDMAYYAYMLLYVENGLAITENVTKEFVNLDHYFKMKKGLIGDPDMYLGAKLQLTQLPNRIVAWRLSTSKYVHWAVQNVKAYLRDKELSKLAKPAAAPKPKRPSSKT